ncbi:hypothetical protein Glove_355g17 [Diversispora epigaea]|uniref:Uncharacterized protein n=1 Tax=Diversispora epigaea TaxID=1348612 RepID=A0A397HFF6_9GLOM|nr:hypothetical protein Glove_355g17 [Diversispora epigaea]
MFYTGTANQNYKFSAQQMHEELVRRVQLGELDESNVPKISTIQNWITGFSREWKEVMERSYGNTPGQVVAFSSRLLLHGNLPDTKGIRNSVYFIHASFFHNLRDFSQIYKNQKDGIERDANGSVVPTTSRQNLNDARELNRQVKLDKLKANQIRVPPTSTDCRRGYIDLRRARRGLKEKSAELAWPKIDWEEYVDLVMYIPKFYLEFFLHVENIFVTQHSSPCKDNTRQLMVQSNSAKIKNLTWEEQNSKLVAEVSELRKKYIEGKAENMKLRQVIEENTELKSEVMKLRHDIEEIKKQTRVITNEPEASPTKDISQ